MARRATQQQREETYIRNKLKERQKAKIRDERRNLKKKQERRFKRQQNKLEDIAGRQILREINEANELRELEKNFVYGVEEEIDYFKVQITDEVEMEDIEDETTQD